VGLGLAAKFSGLRQGGIQVALMCAVIALTIVAQNGTGIALAKTFDMAPSLGLFIGSIPLLGGHGTAAAWAQAPEAAGLNGAFELGIAAATLGLVAGGLVACPVATLLARMAREPPAMQDAATAAPAAAPGSESGAGIAAFLSSDRWLRVLLLIAAALAIGQGLQWIAVKMGVTVPAFLTAMFVAQVTIVVLVALLLVFPLMGRDRQAAIAAGGFIGFALGAMPVGLGTMRRLSESIGPAPRAFLVITLAASLFADAANAIGITTLFALLE
jgi:ESS family glutamate:Na+ symporter